MGGKKKLSMRQMEKAQERKGKQPSEGRSEGSMTKERKSAGILPPNPKSEKVIGELKKIKALTPYAVASRFNLRLSVAKDFLEELEQQGIVETVSGNQKLRVYKPLG